MKLVDGDVVCNSMKVLPVEIAVEEFWIELMNGIELFSLSLDILEDNCYLIVDASIIRGNRPKVFPKRSYLYWISIYNTYIHTNNYESVLIVYISIHLSKNIYK